MNELLKLMHDTSSPVNSIKSLVDLIKQGKLTKEETEKAHDGIKEKANEINLVMDEYFKSSRKINKTFTL